LYDFERTIILDQRSLVEDVRRRAGMPSKPPDLSTTAAGTASADPLDLWLRRDLHQLYSAVTAEPIPPELLRLVAESSEQSQGRGRNPPSPQKRDPRLTNQRGFEQRVRERAYFLWVEEDCPKGRALEHWMLAFTQQVAEEEYERLTG
jgi:hypothetical protein